MARDSFAIIVHTLVQDDAGRTLFLRRANTGVMDGYFSLPGGHREQGETVRACAIRECREEACVVVDDVVPTMVLPYPDGVNFVFTARRWRGTPAIGEPEKCDGLLFGGPDELPDPIVGWVKSVFSGIAAGAWYAEFD